MPKNRITILFAISSTILFFLSSCSYSSLSDFDTLRKYTKREYQNIKMNELYTLCRGRLEKGGYAYYNNETGVLTLKKIEKDRKAFQKQEKLEIMFRENAGGVLLLIQLTLGDHEIDWEHPQKDELSYINQVKELFKDIDSEVAKKGGQLIFSNL